MTTAARVSRRQFGLGAGAVVVATSLPWTAQPWTAQASVPARAKLAALDPRLAQMVRELAKRVRFFEHLSDRYFEDERCSGRWRDHYWPIVKKADAIYARIGRPQTSEEKSLVTWLETIVESETTMARTGWHPLPNLSNRGRWLECMFEEAMIRQAEARLAFSWISRNGWCNPCYPDHAVIMKVFHETETAVRTASHRIRMRLAPRTAGDLQLLRRAWQCRFYPPRCFEVKYYPKVRARHVMAGIVAVRLPPAGDDERNFHFIVPEDAASDGPRTRAARASARRLYRPGRQEKS